MVRMLKLLSGRGVDSISLYTNVSNKADIHGKFNKSLTAY